MVPSGDEGQGRNESVCADALGGLTHLPPARPR